MATPPSDPAGERALRAIAELFSAPRGVLFEPSQSREPHFQATACVGPSNQQSWELTVPSGSLLPRWLRVNASILPVPDTIGVFDALPPSEQDVFRALQSELAVPLLHEGDLVGWVSLTAAASRPDGPAPVILPLLETAAGLHSARKASRERASADAVLRSNRLSVAGEMAAGIAHEVRNPLAAVRSMVQLVRGETVPFEDRNRLLDNVVTEVDRVNRVLSGMLALGRPTAARDERTDLAALATDAVSFCQAYAKQRGEIIRASFSESLWVQGDPHELRQVLVNLLLNACQASEAGQTILVDGASKAEPGCTPQVVIRVMDSGEGMPRSVLDQAFEPFFTTKQDGGGLGLSICRDAVRRHGGSITIASELHVGTIVSVELPQATNASNPSC